MAILSTAVLFDPRKGQTRKYTTRQTMLCEEETRKDLKLGGGLGCVNYGVMQAVEIVWEDVPAR